MAILLGLVTEGEKHLPPDQPLELGRFRAKADLGSGLAAISRVAFDPEQTSARPARQA
jgi:hypothetical protein